MKKMLGILLAMILLLTTASGALAEVKPIAEGEPVTLTYLTSGLTSVITSYNDNKTLQEIERVLNVKIEWIHAPSGQLKEKINVAIATMDMPDMIDSFESNYSKGADDAIDQGIILRLNEMIDEYAPDYKAVLDQYPEVRRQVTTDSGNIWCFPCIEPNAGPAWRGPCIRQDLLTAYNLEMPTTLEELEKVLIAFKENGVQIPLYFNPLKGGAMQDGFLIAGFDMGPNFYMKPDENGAATVHYFAMEDNFLDYLTMLKRWYEEGLLDKEFATRSDDSAESVMTQGIVGAYASGRGYGPTLRIQTNARANGNADFTLELFPNLPLTEGGQVHYRQTDYNVKGNSTVITTSCEHPELAVAYLNFGYSEEGARYYNYGLEGWTYELDENGNPQFTEYVTNNPDGYGWNELRDSIKRHTGSYLRDWAAFPGTEFEYHCMDVWSRANNDYVLPPISLTADESLENARIMGDVEVYVQECMNGFINGSKPLSEFDAFRDTLKTMGIENAIALKQAALIRYNER